jgi:hypothetical protein
MKNIFNLVIYIGIIYLLVELANRLIKNSQEKKNNNKDESFTEEKVVVRGNPTISFDYESVPTEEEKGPIEERYVKELESGAFVYPQYNNNNFTDQRAIYNNDMYAKPIHINRTLDPMGENDLPKTIAQIFDESITDFKKLTPVKKGQTGDFVVRGASNLAVYNPDEFMYDDEKPENGAIFGKDDKYNGNLTIQAYDNMISLDSALF